MQNDPQAAVERESKLGMAFLIKLMRFTGPRIIKMVLVPVTFYYFIRSPAKRQHSFCYLSRLQQFSVSAGASDNHGVAASMWWVFRHFLSFSWSMVDRVHSWSGGLSKLTYRIDDEMLLDEVLSSTTGAIFLTSHLGNFDLAIARSGATPDKVFNVIMNTSETQTYNRFRDQIFNNGQVRFIELGTITPAHAVELIERVSRGEIVVIAADRIIPATTKNSVRVDFLGDSAAIPSGPYILGHLLEVPLYSLIAIKDGDDCVVKFELLEERVLLPRQQRQSAITAYATKFAERLELACLEYPLQWYNFYDFWAKPEPVDGDQQTNTTI